MTPAHAAVSAAVKSIPSLRAEYFRAFEDAKEYARNLTIKEFKALVIKSAKDCELLDTRPGPTGVSPAAEPTPAQWVCLAWGVVEECRIDWADWASARKANDHGEMDD